LIFELATGKYLFSVDDDDLLHIEAIIEHLRSIPRHLISRGRKYSELFDKHGQPTFADVDRNSIENKLVEVYNWSEEDAIPFALFLEEMLELDPDNRPSASKCLEHDWLK